jgi:hypothetical protein
MTASLRAPVLPYKSGFVPSTLATTKLKQDFVGGSVAKDKKCSNFSGEHGIEALLYIEESFRKIASCTLLWTVGPEQFNGFKEVLLDTVLTNWEDIITPISDIDKTLEHFKLTPQEIYHKYVGPKVMAIQFEYFHMLQKPPLKSSTLDHLSQMLMLAHYGYKLPGNEPLLIDEQIKKCIFSSFPLTWQQQYIHSGQQVATTPLLDIVEFMRNEKIFAT